MASKAKLPCRLPSLSPSIQHLFSIFFVGLSGADRDQFSVGVGSAAAALLSWLRRLAVQRQSQFQLGERGWAPALGSARLRC